MPVYLPLKRVATFTGIGGNFKMVWVATLHRNQWQPCTGIRTYIVGGWKNCEEAALLAIYHSKLTQYEKLQFDGRTDGILKIKLPSGRDMIFQKPYIGTGRFGGSVVKVMGTEATTKRYIEI